MCNAHAMIIQPILGNYVFAPPVIHVFAPQCIDAMAFMLEHLIHSKLTCKLHSHTHCKDIKQVSPKVCPKAIPQWIPNWGSKVAPKCALKGGPGGPKGMSGGPALLREVSTGISISGSSWCMRKVGVYPDLFDYLGQTVGVYADLFYFSGRAYTPTFGDPWGKSFNSFSGRVGGPGGQHRQ